MTPRRIAGLLTGLGIITIIVCLGVVVLKDTQGDY